MSGKAGPRRLSRFGAVLCVAYIATFLAVSLQEFEGSWGGFLLYVISMPLSTLILPAASALGLSSLAVNVAFLVVGVAWWYGVGYAAERLVSRRSRG
jgi:hypothetical protein